MDAIKDFFSNLLSSYTNKVFYKKSDSINAIGFY